MNNCCGQLSLMAQSSKQEWLPFGYVLPQKALTMLKAPACVCTKKPPLMKLPCMNVPWWPLGPPQWMKPPIVKTPSICTPSRHGTQASSMHTHIHTEGKAQLPCNITWCSPQGTNEKTLYLKKLCVQGPLSCAKIHCWFHCCFGCRENVSLQSLCIQPQEPGRHHFSTHHLIVQPTNIVSFVLLSFSFIKCIVSVSPCRLTFLTKLQRPKKKTLWRKKEM